MVVMVGWTLADVQVNLQNNETAGIPVCESCHGYGKNIALKELFIFKDLL